VTFFCLRNGTTSLVGTFCYFYPPTCSQSRPTVYYNNIYCLCFQLLYHHLSLTHTHITISAFHLHAGYLSVQYGTILLLQYNPRTSNFTLRSTLNDPTLHSIISFSFPHNNHNHTTTKIESLKQQIQKNQSGKRDQGLGATARAKAPNLAPIRNPPATKMRRALKGHFGKVTAMHWAGDSRHLVTAGQDGKLLIWNAVTSNKIQAITLKSSYVMSVGYEQSKGEMVACGGLDNLCTVYKLSKPDQAMEMASHDGLITCCRFLDESKILTSSGDSTCIRWDIGRGTVLDTFAEHKEHVNFMSLSPTDKNVFVSASVDKTAKVWDIRAPKSAVQTYMGHTGDVNGVDFMPSDGNTFCTCSEDGGIHIFDMRAYNELVQFRVNMALKNNNGAIGTPAAGAGAGGGATVGTASGGGGAGGTGAGGAGAGGMSNTPGMAADTITSVAFSKSGRVIFCGHSDGSVLAFDALSEKPTAGPIFTMSGAHERHVSCLGVSPSGEGLATGSWDTTVKVRIVNVLVALPSSFC